MAAPYTRSDGFDLAAAPAVQLAGTLADTKNMAKKIRQTSSRPLSPGEVRQIKRLHKQRTVLARWHIGKIVNRAIGFGERAAYGTSVLAEYSEQLSGCLGASTLRQLRRLARLWRDERIVKAVTDAGIPLRCALSLMVFDALAATRGLCDADRKIITDCRARIIKDYSKGTLDAGAFRERIADEKLRCLKLVPSKVIRAKRNLLFDGRDIAGNALEALAQRLESDRPVMTQDCRTEAQSLADEIRLTKERIMGFYKRAAKLVVRSYLGPAARNRAQIGGRGRKSRPSLSLSLHTGQIAATRHRPSTRR